MRKATTVGKHAANGRVIYVARKRKGLTQTELGDLAGIRYRQIIRLENGENLPTGRVRDKIAAALDLDPAKILSGDDDPEVALPGDTFRDGAGHDAPAGGTGRVGEAAA